MKRYNILPLLLASSCAALHAANPIVTDVFTADPAALVHNDTVYIYTGHDEAPPDKAGYVMKEWLCFSSTDMDTWTPHGSPMSLKTFPWAADSAWAGHAVERDGKFYWYVPVYLGEGKGFGIGVGVADNPTGPFVDAVGGPILTSDMTPDPALPNGTVVSWDDIDPAIFIDDDGQAYMFWGNYKLKYVKLKPNMTEIEGDIEQIDITEFTEAPWVHKRGDTYYLTYATQFPERTAYATAKSINGPWEVRGIIKQLAGNCNTNHQAIIDFKGRSYFIYHNGGTPTGGSFRRSVCIEYLNYNEDGTIKEIHETLEGVSKLE